MEIALSNPIVVEKIINNLPVTDMLNCRNVSPLFRECAERVLRSCYNKIMISNISESTGSSNDFISLDVPIIHLVHGQKNHHYLLCSKANTPE